MLYYMIAFLILLSAMLKLYVRVTTGICTSARRLDGKTIIVTGANTGIGKETAHDLAQRGAKVILGCRDLKRGKAARDDIIAKTGNMKVEVRHLDLSSFASIRKFSSEIIKTEPHLDVLINNAAAMGLGNKKTADGLLIGMQINHFGPFLLTCLLLGNMAMICGGSIFLWSFYLPFMPSKQWFLNYDLLKKSTPSRIIMVSALLHKCAKFDIDNLNFEKWFNDYQVYNCSKLANILTANELSAKLKGTGVTVNSLHPGVILTDLGRHLPPLILPIASFFTWMFFKNVRDGAQTSIHLAVSEEVEGVTGKYFVDCKEGTISRTAEDMGLAKKLWEKSEIIVGLKPEEKHY